MKAGLGSIRTTVSFEMSFGLSTCGRWLNFASAGMAVSLNAYGRHVHGLQRDSGRVGGRWDRLNARLGGQGVQADELHGMLVEPKAALGGW